MARGENAPLLQLDGGDEKEENENDIIEDVIDTLHLAIPIFISRVSFTGVSDVMY